MACLVGNWREQPRAEAIFDVVWFKEIEDPYQVKAICLHSIL